MHRFGDLNHLLVEILIQKHKPSLHKGCKANQEQHTKHGSARSVHPRAGSVSVNDVSEKTAMQGKGTERSVTVTEAVCRWCVGKPTLSFSFHAGWSQ